MSGFSLRDGNGALLIALPTTLVPTTPLGEPDPFTWDRMPGGARFALGTGLGAIRPVFALSGMTGHRSVVEAAQLMAAIQQALPNARTLHFGGVPVSGLEPEYPGSYLPTFGEGRYTVRHELVLNTLGAVLPTNFTGGSAPPPPTTPGTNTTQAVLTPTTIYIEGEPVTIQVWRQP